MRSSSCPRFCVMFLLMRRGKPERMKTKANTPEAASTAAAAAQWRSRGAVGRRRGWERAGAREGGGGRGEGRRKRETTGEMAWADVWKSAPLPLRSAATRSGRCSAGHEAHTHTHTHSAEETNALEKFPAVAAGGGLAEAAEGKVDGGSALERLAQEPRARHRVRVSERAERERERAERRRKGGRGGK